MQHTDKPRLAGRSAIVTGAAQGIGLAIAGRFAREGASVVLADIDDRVIGCAERLAGEGFTATASVFDVGDSSAWDRLAEEFRGSGHELDILVNNAFALTVAPAHEQTDEQWDRQLLVNVSAVHRAVRAFIASLARRRGVIVNVSSVHARVGFRGHPAYAASKGALESLTRQLAVEYGPEVRVNAVLPGSITTRVWDGATEQQLADASRQAALQRMGDPDEVAAAVCFLVGDEASFITGASLLVDGGFSAVKDAI